MVDKNYVRYKNRYKNKAPSRGDHLEPFKWKPGQSGNPTGRGNGGPSLVERLKAYLRRHPEDVDTLVEQLVKLGKNANISQLQAIDKIMDRVDGRVVEKHQIEGGLPIRIEFVPAQAYLAQKERGVIEGQTVELLTEAEK